MKAIRATFYVPQTPSGPADELRHKLTLFAGGLTRSVGHGSYINKHGVRVDEPVYIFDVLVQHGSDKALEVLENLSNKYRQDANQEVALYFAQGMLICTRDTADEVEGIPLELRNTSKTTTTPTKVHQLNVGHLLERGQKVRLHEPALTSTAYGSMELDRGEYEIAGAVGYWADGQLIVRIRTQIAGVMAVVPLPQSAVITAK